MGTQLWESEVSQADLNVEFEVTPADLQTWLIRILLSPLEAVGTYLEAKNRYPIRIHHRAHRGYGQLCLPHSPIRRIIHHQAS
jgi:hypothetical protein